MKTIDNQIYFSIGEVAGLLGVTNQTIKNWYRWQRMMEEREDVSEDVREVKDILPHARMDMDNRQTRYFTSEAVEALKQFRGRIEYGLLADFSRTRWGVRGKR